MDQLRNAIVQLTYALLNILQTSLILRIIAADSILS